MLLFFQQNIINMSIPNNSYFAKHKLVTNRQSKVKGNKLNNSSSGVRSDDHKVQEIVLEKHKSNQASFIDLSFLEEKTEEQKVYEQYKFIKAKYEQELVEINAEIERLKKESQNEIKKVKHAETALDAKKKQLRATKQRYEQMKTQYQKQEVQGVSNDKVLKLQRQLAQITAKNVEKIKQLQQEQEKSRQQNARLQQKYDILQEEYKKALQFDQTKFDQQKKQLEDQQKRLKQQLEMLEKQSEKIKKDIQKIQDMKPVKAQVHKRYLDLFQKMFISQQLAKAEKIMNLKQEQRKHNIQLVRRKEWIKEKQKQILQREAKVAQKNKLVDKLTAEIRQKSTLLLTKYQVEADKHKK